MVLMIWITLCWNKDVSEDLYSYIPKNCEILITPPEDLVLELSYTCTSEDYFPEYNQIKFVREEADDRVTHLKTHTLRGGSVVRGELIGINAQSGLINITFGYDPTYRQRCRASVTKYGVINGTGLHESCQFQAECIAHTDHSRCHPNFGYCDCADEYCQIVSGAGNTTCALCPGLGDDCPAGKCSGSGVVCGPMGKCQCDNDYVSYNGICVERSFVTNDVAARVAIISAAIIAVSLVLGIAWNGIKRHSRIQRWLQRRRERHLEEHRRTGSVTSMSQEIESRLRDRPPAYQHALEDKPPSYDDSMLEAVPPCLNLQPQALSAPPVSPDEEASSSFGTSLNIVHSCDGFQNPGYDDAEDL